MAGTSPRLASRHCTAYVTYFFLHAWLDFNRLTLLVEYFVDVQDVGRLHVAATILSHVQSQRVFAFGGRFNWDAILEIMRKRDPSRKLPDNFSGGEDPNEIEPRPAAERLLQELGFPGWTSLEDCIAHNVEGL
jgi:hypothetical protein